MRLRNQLLLGAIYTGLLLPHHSVAAQATVFSYQGRLQHSGGLANGIYDLRFTLYDHPTAGNAVAEPVQLAGVTVADGLFTARLDFGTNAYPGPDRWLGIAVSPAGVTEFTVLLPRQEITSVPYAIRAQSAGTASLVAPGATVTSLNALRDDVILAAGANLTITPDGNTLTLSAAGAGGSGIWSVNGNNATYVAGNVGIGTASPVHRLAISGGPSWTANQWRGAVELQSGAAIAWPANAANQRFGMGHTSGGFLLFRTASNPGTTASPAIYDFMVTDAGNIGIGTITPSSKLEIAAQDGLKITGFQPFLTLRDSNSGNARGVIQSANGSINLLTDSFLTGINTRSFLKIDNGGNVGIGSSTPGAKLEVAAQDALRLVGYQPFLTLIDNDAGFARTRVQGIGGEMLLEPESFINGSNPNAFVRLSNSGNLSVRTLTIRGGADLAEPFEISGKEVEPGCVVVIDSHHPGKLKRSEQAYDKRVAGVVSGANGVHPAIRLQQDGVLDRGQDVALSGRVYVRADAQFGAIQPGDLLTSSDTPGHAMKAADHARTPGAILGKAMSELSEGQGLVLLLVTLQ